jgi:hypothetical protein
MEPGSRLSSRTLVRPRIGVRRASGGNEAYANLLLMEGDPAADSGRNSDPS